MNAPGFYEPSPLRRRLKILLGLNGICSFGNGVVALIALAVGGPRISAVLLLVASIVGLTASVATIARNRGNRGLAWIAILGFLLPNLALSLGRIDVGLFAGAVLLLLSIPIGALFVLLCQWIAIPIGAMGLFETALWSFPHSFPRPTRPGLIHLCLFGITVSGLGTYVFSVALIQRWIGSTLLAVMESIPTGPFMVAVMSPILLAASTIGFLVQRRRDHEFRGL